MYWPNTPQVAFQSHFVGFPAISGALACLISAPLRQRLWLPQQPAQPGSVVDWARGFQSSAAAQEEIKISVPQMGDSISEGTVASLEHKAGNFQGHRRRCSEDFKYNTLILDKHRTLKQPLNHAGDVVKEDDVLLQIETDKVTIDVRYTESQPGTIREYLVSEEDTVTVGQEVCVVDKGATEGAGGGAEGVVPTCLRLAAMHTLSKLEPVAQHLMLATTESTRRWWRQQTREGRKAQGTTERGEAKGNRASQS